MLQIRHIAPSYPGSQPALGILDKELESIWDIDGYSLVSLILLYGRCPPSSPLSPSSPSQSFFFPFPPVAFSLHKPLLFLPLHLLLLSPFFFPLYMGSMGWCKVPVERLFVGRPDVLAGVVGHISLGT